MDETNFFVVWNPERGLPRYRHESYDEALAEAKRLANITRGERFYVLGAVAVASVRDPVEVIQFVDPDNYIPF